MIRDLQDKVAVVTGAASGIGAALAEGLAQRGMKVVAADVDSAGARATSEKIGADALAVQCDVASAASVAALADRAFDHYGQVDLLINNAGVFQGGLMWERSVEDWEWSFGVNVYGIIHAVRSFVPRMIAQDTEGHVVNTASVAAFVPAPTSGPYIVSKCAALSLSECLAHDLAAVGSKIGASVLTPSAFATEIAHTSRVRPAELGTDQTLDGKGTAEALAGIVSQGLAPEAAVEPVVAAIQAGDFLIPTKPSYRAQIENRLGALLERKLPQLVDVD